MILSRNRRPTVAVPSPYPADDQANARPRWWERLRGLAGKGLILVLTGVLVAVIVGVVLLALAIYLATGIT